MKKEVEGHIIRLAQKSRAAGIHLVAGDAEADGGRHHRPDQVEPAGPHLLPGVEPLRQPRGARRDGRRQAARQGRHALPAAGHQHADPRPGHLRQRRGDHAASSSTWKCEPCYAAGADAAQGRRRSGEGSALETLRARDDLYEQAIEVVVREGRGSVSLLQRALGIGYGRAARLIDFMAEDGIVGAYNGSNAREVLYTPEQWEQMKQGGETAGECVTAKEAGRISFVFSRRGG